MRACEASRKTGTKQAGARARTGPRMGRLPASFSPHPTYTPPFPGAPKHSANAPVAEAPQALERKSPTVSGTRAPARPPTCLRLCINHTHRRRAIPFHLLCCEASRVPPQALECTRHRLHHWPRAPSCQRRPARGRLFGRPNYTSLAYLLLHL